MAWYMCRVFKDEALVELTVYSNKIESTVWQAATVGIMRHSRCIVQHTAELLIRANVT